MHLTDFARSYILWNTKKDNSYGRFNIECHLIIGQKEYFLGSGVMACNMYSHSGLIICPSYYYQAIFSLEEHHIFRKSNTNFILENSSGLNSERFNSLEIHKKEKKYSFVSQPNEKIIRGEPIVASMEIEIADTKAILYFPINHLNYSPQYKMIQVETGPVVMPDITINHYNSIRNLALYYIAFNSYTEVDMLITSRENEVPLPENIYTKRTNIKLFQSVL